MDFICRHPHFKSNTEAAVSTFNIYCMRKDGIEKIILTVKIARKRARGRQRITFLHRIVDCSGMSEIELIQC